MAINPNVTHFPMPAVPHNLPMMGRPLAKKLAEVLSDVTRVPKNGRNDFHKYDYVTESDLVDHIRDKLAKKGVALFPSVREHHTEEMQDAKHRTVFLTTVMLDVTLIDGESGDMMTTSWVGQGLDNADKGYYKAYTGAIKYFLLKTFMISTGDDPEIDDAPRPIQRRQKPASKNKMASRTTRIVKDTAKSVESAVEVPKEVEDRWTARSNEFKALLEESVDEEMQGCFERLYLSHMSAKSLKEIDAPKIGAMCRKLRSMNVDARRKYIRGVLEENEGKKKPSSGSEDE